ncbi:MAG TPA: sugar kinase [Anaeromyxobacter sp.]|nr:sugar kinase [Anaeromyxobacter sp.]
MTSGPIVTIGEVLVEIMAVDPGEGFRAPIRLVGPFPSGAPAIFIDQVGRLGHPCGIVSCVGADDFGRVNLDRLRADGVDVSAVRVHPEVPTGSAFVRYRPDGQRDFVFNIKHSACGAIALDAAAEALLDRARHLHVMGSSLSSPSLVDMNRAAIARVKGRGGTVSFDPNCRKEIMGLPGMREALDEVLARADLFLPSGPELLLFTKAQEERAAIRELLDRGVRAVVLKRGAAGASYHGPEGDLSVAGHAVEEIDPTGAGDCFGATFVTCWLEGLGPARALALANASGALAVCRKGPMEGASTRAELEAFLARAAQGGRA